MIRFRYPQNGFEFLKKNKQFLAFLRTSSQRRSAVTTKESEKAILMNPRTINSRMMQDLILSDVRSNSLNFESEIPFNKSKIPFWIKKLEKSEWISSIYKSHVLQVKLNYHAH